MPSSQQSGRFYAYHGGCFKVTAGGSATHDSQWLDDWYRWYDWHPTNRATSQGEYQDAKPWMGIAHYLGVLPKTLQAMGDGEAAAVARGAIQSPQPQVYFSPYFSGSGYSDKECYALLHGYHWALSGNPASVRRLGARCRRAMSARDVGARSRRAISVRDLGV